MTIHRVKALLAGIALVVLGAAPAFAGGTMFVLVSKGWLFRNGNIGCSFYDHAAASGTETTIRCAGGTVGRFMTTVPFPSGASNSWAYQASFFGQGPNGSVCSWTVQAFAMREGSLSISGTNAATVTSSAFSDFNWHYTSSPSATVNDSLTSGSCTATPSNCVGAFVELNFSLETTLTTADTCDLRMIRIDY